MAVILFIASLRGCRSPRLIGGAARVTCPTSPRYPRQLYRRALNGLKDNMPSKSAKPRRPDLREKPSARRVAIVTFPGVTLLDISGPAQVFAELQEIELPAASYLLSYLSA